MFIFFKYYVIFDALINNFLFLMQDAAKVKEVSEGRRYVIFPEGGYDNNKNELQEFKHGAFKVNKSYWAEMGFDCDKSLILNPLKNQV